MIKNRYEDCKLACANCGDAKHLMQVAHRNDDDSVVGYVFLCKECLPIIEGKYSVYLKKE